VSGKIEEREDLSRRGTQAEDLIATASTSFDVTGEREKPKGSASDLRLVRRGEEIKQRLNARFGVEATLLPVHPRSKAAVYRNHQRANLAAMQDPRYLEALGWPDRNVGVLLGRASNGVCTLDFDRQEHAETFLELNPALRHTLITAAARGCNLWIVITCGNYPPSFDIKDDAGDNIVEFRGDKRQTLIEGVHPSGVRYQMLNVASPVRLRWNEIAWPPDWRGEASARGAASRSAIETAGNAEYDKLVAAVGPPVLIGDEGRVTINQVALAKKFLIENPIEFRVGLGFTEYLPGNGIWKRCSRASIKKALSCDIARYADQIEALGLKFKSTDRVLTELVNLVEAHGEAELVARAHPELIHLGNGMLDIGKPTPELLAFSPDYNSFNCVPYKYDPAAKCDRFMEFLNGALSPSDVVLVQKWAGMALGGINFAQAILLLVGVAKAGKGTFVDITTQLISLESCELLRTSHLDKRFELARYIGKTLLVGPDVRGDFLNLAGAQMLKSLTGGDFLTAELKGENQSVRLKGMFNVCVTSNRRQRVALDGDHDAWGRRLKVVEFTRVVEKVNPDLAEQIVKKEASGVINWMVQGLIALRRDFELHGAWRLEEEQKSRIENLLMESDSVLYFVHEEIVIGSEADSLTVFEVRHAYDRFCDDHGWAPQSKAVVERELPHVLTDKFKVAKRHDICRERTQQRGWRGIKLKNPVVHTFASDML
jgi:P4 family phage/plasmid primase-like protien